MDSNLFREVTHLWYSGWPERGVPSDLDSLVEFLQETRRAMKTNIGPTVVHCRWVERGVERGGEELGSVGTVRRPAASPDLPLTLSDLGDGRCSPGTGRTGVLLACDICMRQFDASRTADIMRTVFRIRHDRAGAVQTREQYALVYKVRPPHRANVRGRCQHV